MTDAFGIFVSPWDVERAVINVLRTPPPGGAQALLVYYVAEWERNEGLTARTIPQPPGTDSYRGGVDADTMQAEWFPMVHVVVQPDSGPTMLDTFTYGQTFRTTITATYGDDDEKTARMVAQAYAICAAKLMVDQGGLGIGVTHTAITRMPTLSLLAPSNRQVLRSVVELESSVMPVLTQGGPNIWQPDAYDSPLAFPTVETVNITVAT